MTVRPTLSLPGQFHVAYMTLAEKLFVMIALVHELVHYLGTSARSLKWVRVTRRGLLTRIEEAPATAFVNRFSPGSALFLTQTPVR